MFRTPPGNVVDWTAWSNRKIAATPRQASCELAGEAVVLHMDSGLYYGLNEVGSVVWKRIAAQASISANELRELVLAAFEVDSATCEQDLLELLGELERVGLIEVTDEEPG